MKILAGTSGFSYKEWKGDFYPEKLPNNKMLEFYAEKLPSVEINNTFYRVPKSNLLESWVKQVPADFRFAVKATRRITHIKRLKETSDETGYFLDTIQSLGKQLGAILFQLPPSLRKDSERLQSFLDLVPKGTPAAFEFRHISWFDDDIYQRLKAGNFALCIADTGDDAQTPLISTADWGYLRLRRVEYSKSQLKSWMKQIGSQGWDHAFVFFKHEDEATGPNLAAQFLQLAGQN
ncbi:MAG: DUF72 domain-containing protein [Gammaproteobacteria bacterium]|nr:DUF72 domain-containing protein [Gammaproteobacteria bacterium]